jgi:predicted TIM-barrel fold metal-dependent hydrolase
MGQNSPHLPVREAWLALVQEPPLDPQLPIIDAHHHLWDRSGHRYLLDDYLADINASGHKVVGSIYVQCRTMFDLDRPVAWRSVGEVEFANGVAACSASGNYGEVRVNAGIVAGADLQLGAGVDAVLDEMRARAGRRLCGVRNTTAWHPNPAVVSNPSPPPAGILASAQFRAGVACLQRHGLSLDVWGYHSQLPEIIELAKAFPEQAIIVDHMGGPLGIGPYAGKRAEVFADWAALISSLAQLTNVRIKLGGLGMRVCGFELQHPPLPPTSALLAELWAPYVLHCIEAFGVERCMFESNFPVDKGMYGYGVMWNAFKRLTQGFSVAERSLLFSGVAAATYRLPL